MAAAAPREDAPTLRATCWGTRGSVPAPGPETVRYGGNTPCLEVRGPRGGRYLFDAGTGLRAWGRRLAADEEEAPRAELFVTHFHWDHIQGFPFCEPLYRSGTRLRVHGPRRGELDVARALAEQMSPAYFPVALDTLAARVAFADVGDGPWSDGEVEVEAAALHHPGGALGYRIRAGGASLAYLPDNEIGEAGGRDETWYSGLVAFLSGADVLFHDAMFTAEEYAPRRGWGHSTGVQAARLAEDAGVRRLYLFHHAPDRSDGDIDALVQDLRGVLRGRGSPLEVHAAAEGVEVAVPGAPVPHLHPHPHADER